MDAGRHILTFDADSCRKRGQLSGVCLVDRLLMLSIVEIDGDQAVFVVVK